MGYNGYIDFALKEKAGAEVLIKIKPLLFDIPKAKIGEKSINDKEIDKHFQELISEFDKHSSELGLSEEDMKKTKKHPSLQKIFMMSGLH